MPEAGNEPMSDETTAWRVTQVGSEHVAECDHGDSVWTIHRSTDHLARRSLEAHLRHEHTRVLPPGGGRA